MAFVEISGENGIVVVNSNHIVAIIQARNGYEVHLTNFDFTVGIDSEELERLKYVLDIKGADLRYTEPRITSLL